MLVPGQHLLTMETVNVLNLGYIFSFRKTGSFILHGVPSRAVPENRIPLLLPYRLTICTSCSFLLLLRLASKRAFKYMSCSLIQAGLCMAALHSLCYVLSCVRSAMQAGLA